MNDEWSRCPICFEDYSLAHRPTTFVCGHSTCIDHTKGPQRLQYCPICRHQLTRHEEYHISYNLEEASRLFQLIKNTIDWSTIKLPSEPVVNDNHNSSQETLHRDEIYARRLQAKLNRESTNTRRYEAQVPAAATILPTEVAAPGATQLEQNQPRGHRKRCGHQCDLVSTTQCCTCSDRRPQRPNNRYETYVDGRGIENRVGRNEYYCSTCKRQ